MSRDWSKVRYLETVGEVQAYLREVYGVRVSRRTLYNWGGDDFLPLPLNPPSRPKRGPGTRGLIPVVVIADWVAVRFHLPPRA